MSSGTRQGADGQRQGELVGLDVIHVHRLLENTVDLPEYLLVSDHLFRDEGAAAPAREEIPQDL